MLTGKQGKDWLTCSNNWNAVCVANTVTTGVAYSKSDEEREFFIKTGCNYIKYYLKSFSSDGYCSEGIGYWEYGFSNYIYFSEIVRRATNGHTDPLLWPQALKPALFPFRAEIVNGTYPAFADCYPNPKPFYMLLGFISKRLGLGHSTYEKTLTNPADVELGWPFFLSYILYCPKMEDAEPDNKIKIDNGIRTWFNEAQILICRGNEGVKSALGAVFKGGINAGSHHHIDIGSYTIVSKSAPVLTDPGAEVYTKRSFSKDRFTSKVLSSYGHPVPVINKKLQKAGKDTKAKILATDFTPDLDTFSIDMKNAYDDPTLNKLVRTFRFDRKNSAVEIEDSFEFTTPGKFENALITFGKMEKLPDGKLKITDKDRSVFVKIFSTCGPVSISEDVIDENLPNKQKPLRIALKLDPQVLKGTVKIRISALP